MHRREIVNLCVRVCVRERERECERGVRTRERERMDREKKKTLIRVLLSKDRAIFQNFTRRA